MSKQEQYNGEGWQHFRVEELVQKVAGDNARLHEFIRLPGLSSAVYRLPVGCKDMQSPHAEDEVYYVLEGRARLRIGDKDQQVGPGSILFVEADTAHSFFDIEEDLTVLAFFGPLPGRLR